MRLELVIEDVVRMRRLVDDLCQVALGWRTDEEHELFLAAYDRVLENGIDARRCAKIEMLRKRIVELEAKRSEGESHKK